MTSAPQSQTHLYRSRDGMVLGVCKGVADYFNFSLFWVRCVTFVVFLFSGLWASQEQEFYHSYAGSRSMALQRLKRSFDKLDRRVQRLEHLITNREHDWARRFHAS